MGCTLQRGRFRLWKSSTSGCIRSRGDAKLSFLSLPSPMVPWQCETSTKQPGQKKHFENPRHNLVCPTTRTYSICSEFYMLDLKLFFAFDMSFVTNLAFQQWPTIKFSWSKIYACWKDLHRLGLFHLCPQPPSLYQSNDWALAEVLSANCDPRSPAPNVDWEPRGCPGKNLEIEVPTSTMMRNTIVATLCRPWFSGSGSIRCSIKQQTIDTTFADIGNWSRSPCLQHCWLWMENNFPPFWQSHTSLQHKLITIHGPQNARSRGRN